MNKTIRKVGFIIILISLISWLAVSPVLALSFKYGYFPDVQENHWAKQVITKMNLRGVAAGIPEGNIVNFKPNQDVTKLEAVLFASRTMGLQGQDDGDVVSRYIPFEIPSWVSRSSIVEAMDADLIVGNTFNCNQKASRAWVAQLLVRMIGKEKEINQVAQSTLPFKDSGQIPQEYLNYVKVAYKYGLIAGNTDQTFAPNDPVTRAQILAFLSRAEKYLDLQDPSLLIGYITDIQGNNLKVQSQGREYVLVIDISSNLYNPTGEIWGTNLRVNDQVYIVADGNKVQYLEIGNFSDYQNNPVEITPEQATGTIVQVYPAEQTIIIRNKEGQPETITVEANTKLVNDNKQSLKIDDLVKGQEVKVEYVGQKPSQVIVLTGTYLSGDEGIVFDVDPVEKMIILKKGNDLEGYFYDQDTEILIAKKPLATISDIQNGDLIRFKVADGFLESIQLVATGVELNNVGMVSLIDLEQRLLTYKLGDKDYKTLLVAPQAKIDFAGDAGTLADINVGDKINVHIENESIVRISVTSRKLYEKMQGILVGNDSSNRVITFRDEHNNLQAYEVSTGAEVRLNNRNVYLSSLEKDMQLEIEINDNRITYLNAKDTLLATIIGVNTNTRVMDLSLTTGERKTYNIASNYNVYQEGRTSYGLSDLARGDIVEVKIENGRIKDIKVERAVIFEITEVTPKSNRIRVKDQKSDSRYLYLYSDVDLDIFGQGNADIQDLKKGDVIKATYLGYTLQKVEMAPVIIGTISAVDSNKKTIALRAYDGQVHSFEFTSYSRVIKNGYSYTTMGTASVGNRVAVQENINGGRNFSLMSSISGQVGFIYDDKSKIYLKKTQTTWDGYAMVPNSYLHNGQVELTPGDIQADDYVEIFMADDIVYEVLKK